ncbi:MAG TPA: DUF1802 family protein [Leptolyngbyaceae cyanobacterium]
MEALSEALKEWAVAIDALLRGDQILLLRKGGIREEKGHFAIKADRILLFPTYEHQQPNLVKEPYRQAVSTVESGHHPATIAIAGWAEITHSIPLEQASPVFSLEPFHIWSEQFVQERWAWKPNRALNVLLLRSHRLSTPVSLPYRPEYGGCRSWITLADSVSLAGSHAVLSEEVYQAQVQQILALLNPSLEPTRLV